MWNKFWLWAAKEGKSHSNSTEEQPNDLLTSSEQESFKKISILFSENQAISTKFTYKKCKETQYKEIFYHRNRPWMPFSLIWQQGVSRMWKLGWGTERIATEALICRWSSDKRYQEAGCRSRSLEILSWEMLADGNGRRRLEKEGLRRRIHFGALERGSHPWNNTEKEFSFSFFCLPPRETAQLLHTLLYPN